MHPLVKIDRRVLTGASRVRADPPLGPPGVGSLYTDGPFDWDEVEEYLRVGYRLVANKRMLAAMDA